MKKEHTEQEKEELAILSSVVTFGLEETVRSIHQFAPSWRRNELTALIPTVAAQGEFYSNFKFVATPVAEGVDYFEFKKVV